MTKSNQAALFVVLTVFGLPGCQSPRTRAERYQEEFVQLTPEQQMQAQSGRVETGYTKSMVRIAKGDPNERSQKRVGSTLIETWIYHSKPQLAEPAPHAASPAFYGSYSAPGFGPGPSTPTPLFYNQRDLTVTFENGRVARVTGPQ